MPSIFAARALLPLASCSDVALDALDALPFLSVRYLFGISAINRPRLQ
jgi:hypothetical protein